VVEREAAVRDLSSRLVMAQREAREVHEISIQNEATMERHIVALQNEVARLRHVAKAREIKVREIKVRESLASSPGGLKMLAAGPSLPKAAAVSHMSASESTELVNELRVAIESLEIRNFELRGALAAVRVGPAAVPTVETSKKQETRNLKL
jgi:hypothetical protein